MIEPRVIDQIYVRSTSVFLLTTQGQYEIYLQYSNKWHTDEHLHTILRNFMHAIINN